MNEPFLEIDMKGEAVKVLQELLDVAGFPQPGDVSQIFGPATRDAVMAYQSSRGLDVDGKVGPETWTALKSGAAAVAEPTQPRPAPQHESLLVVIGLTAEQRFGLSVHECDAPDAPARWRPAHPGVHSPTSLHYEGRAFDIGGSAEQMHDFTEWVVENHGSQLEELIHNPNGSIDGGIERDPIDFWGPTTWEAHRNHVHLAV